MTGYGPDVTDVTDDVEVLLVTDAARPDGEPGHELLDAALAVRGISSRWAVWDDPFVDWAVADVVVVRSVGDHDTRRADFLGWAQHLGPALLPGCEALRWNTDRAYLVELAERPGLPVVPTLAPRDPVELRAAISRFGTAVVKPRVGLGGRGVAVVHDDEPWFPADPGPWVVQPLLPDVHQEGELSVFVILGRPVSQLRRGGAASGDGVHAVPLSPEAALLAVDAVAATTEILGVGLSCARVDLLADRGALLVSGVEIAGPDLFLDLLPQNADRLAEAVDALL